MSVGASSASDISLSNRAVTQRLSRLDLAFFEQISSQSSDGDKRSLLACQAATRELRQGYGYLEIGSYLGGSIQPHLVDPSCGSILSIDKRPPSQPDNSGLTIRFPNNSTHRMLENLRRIPGGNIDKLRWIDAETSSLDRSHVVKPVHLCFIDGEHTDTAVMADYRFCASAIDDSGAVIFHDAQIIHNGLSEVIQELQAEKRSFHAYNLADVLFVIELGEFPLHRHPLIAEMLVDNHVGYLASLRRNDHFRRWANTQPLRSVRALKARFEGTSLSE